MSFIYKYKQFWIKDHTIWWKNSEIECHQNEGFQYSFPASLKKNEFIMEALISFWEQKKLAYKIFILISTLWQSLKLKILPLTRFTENFLCAHVAPRNFIGRGNSYACYRENCKPFKHFKWLKLLDLAFISIYTSITSSCQHSKKYERKKWIECVG